MTAHRKRSCNFIFGAKMDPPPLVLVHVILGIFFGGVGKLNANHVCSALNQTRKRVKPDQRSICMFEPLR